VGAIEAEPTAAALAARLLEASGGSAGWESTRCVSWIHLGHRLYVWDKATGDLRVENKMTVVLMNLGSGRGRAWRYGQEIVDPAALERALDFAIEAWQVDSHELLLPFLLGGSEVRLDYAGEGEIDGRATDGLRVTFAEGFAYSRAAYLLHLDRQSGLIARFDYYMDAGDPRPRFAVPWLNYRKHGRILLSDDRGNRRHTYLRVLDAVPASVFTSPEPVPWLADHLESAPAGGS
jgi:hypothetical protein